MNTTGLRIGTLAVVVALTGCQTARVNYEVGVTAPEAVLGEDQRAFAEALALYSQGLIYELHRDYEAALAYYSRAVELDPENEELYFRIATGLLRQNRNGEAVQRMEELAGKRPKSPKALRWLALIYRAADQPAESEAVYKRWMEVDPTNPAPYIQLASLYLSNGRAPEAVAVLEGAREQVASPVEILRALADVHVEVSRTAESKPTLDESMAAAISVYQRVLSIQPDDQFALNRLGELYQENGQLQQAVTYYEGLEKKIPESLLLKEKLAEALLALGDKRRCLRVLESMVELDPANARLHFYLGDLYQQTGELDRAGEHFERAIAIEPSDPTGYLKLAILNMVNDPANAAEVLQLGLRRMPGDETLLKTLAHVHFSHGEFAAAARYFARALVVMEAQPEPEISPNFLFNYAVAALRADDLDTAVAMLTRAMDSNPAFLDAFVQFVFGLNENDTVARAATLLEQLQAEADSLPRLNYYLGMVYNYLEEYPKAVAAFEAFENALAAAPALALDTEMVGAPFYFWFGSALERSGRYEDAERRFLQVIEEDPESGEAYNYIAYMWSEQNKNLEQALTYITKGLALEPDNGAFVDTRGWIFYQMGEYEKALADIERAAELMPDDATIVDHMGDALLKVGNEQEALVKWKRSFVLDPTNEKVAEKLSSRGVDLDALRIEAEAYQAEKAAREAEKDLEAGAEEEPGAEDAPSEPNEPAVPVASPAAP
jgi:tetratricopeptide (TPR) repeat protein